MNRSTYLGVTIVILLVAYFLSPPYVGHFVSTLDADNAVRQGVAAFYRPAMWLGRAFPPYQRLLISLSVDLSNPEGVIDERPGEKYTAPYNEPGHSTP